MGILLKFRSSSSSILQHSSQQEQQPAAAEQQQPPPPPADQQQLQTSCSSRPVAAEQQLQQSRGEAAAIKFQQQQRLRVLKMCFSVFPWSMTASSFSALFYSALLCAREMLAHEDGSADQDLLRALNNRLLALSFHIREYYWTDMKKLNEIFRYKTEEYSFDAVNKFNIYPDQISPWFVEWMPDKGGYFIGNLQPTHMDFRFFSLGNLWSIVNSLATTQQSHAILDLVEAKLSDLVADMPFKICCTALEGQEWRIITGNDKKKHAMVIP